MLKAPRLFNNFILIAFFTFFSFVPCAFADIKNSNLGEDLYNTHPNSVLYYYGLTGTVPLIRMFYGQFERYPEHIQSLEYAYTLDKQNAFRAFLSPIVSVVQLAGNVTVRNGTYEPTIYEFDPYIIFRWANMPWNHYVVTSLAIAEGVSYASSVPSIEKKDNDNTKRLLNYLMFEATFALPSRPEWQVALRIHHRSGAYGAYGAGNGGSNDLGLAIRYLF